ncbi:hypothetical protein [Allosphingosinicella indica]|uniref:Uncharacterized protein n=1 Tax=Allosphingosinicella indica TaxID=941907 RepID=A0A1X7GJC8_9SPHN|nr:hypothetical protein [Allosphingosinicella indica]SMF70635.1 hypothetical protein SAMN06295910_1917 [Allosphingosinicella indica]
MPALPDTEPTIVAADDNEDVLVIWRGGPRLYVAASAIADRMGFTLDELPQRMTRRLREGFVRNHLPAIRAAAEAARARDPRFTTLTDF